MQSSKTSKKTRKIGQENAPAAPENSTPAPEANAKSRTSRPPATKKETSDTGRAKHRNASATEPAVEIATVKRSTSPAKSASRAVDSPVIDPVGVMTSSTDPIELVPTPIETSFSREIAHEHIAKLAHSYWIARDYAHGFAEEDWRRAERELKNKR